MDEMTNQLETVEEVQYIVVKLGDEQYGIDTVSYTHLTLPTK